MEFLTTPPNISASTNNMVSRIPPSLLILYLRFMESFLPQSKLSLWQTAYHFLPTVSRAVMYCSVFNEIHTIFVLFRGSLEFFVGGDGFFLGGLGRVNCTFILSPYRLPKMELLFSFHLINLENSLSIRRVILF